MALRRMGATGGRVCAAISTGKPQGKRSERQRHGPVNRRVDSASSLLGWAALVMLAVAVLSAAAGDAGGDLPVAALGSECAKATTDGAGTLRSSGPRHSSSASGACVRHSSRGRATELASACSWPQCDRMLQPWRRTAQGPEMATRTESLSQIWLTSSKAGYRPKYAAVSAAAAESGALPAAAAAMDTSTAAFSKQVALEKSITKSRMSMEYGNFFTLEEFQLSNKQNPSFPDVVSNRLRFLNYLKPTQEARAKGLNRNAAATVAGLVCPEPAKSPCETVSLWHGLRHDAQDRNANRDPLALYLTQKSRMLSACECRGMLGRSDSAAGLEGNDASITWPGGADSEPPQCEAGDQVRSEESSHLRQRVRLRTRGAGQQRQQQRRAVVRRSLVRRLPQGQQVQGLPAHRRRLQRYWKRCLHVAQADPYA